MGKQATVLGIRRLEGGKLQYLSHGGWIGWNMLAPAQQLTVLSRVECGPYTTTSNASGFIMTPFEVVWSAIGATASEPIEPLFDPETIQDLLDREEEIAAAERESAEQISGGNEPADDGDSSGSDTDSDETTDGDDDESSQSGSGSGSSAGGSCDDKTVFYVHSEGFELLEGGPIVSEMIATAVDAEATVTAGILDKMDKDLRDYARQSSDVISRSNIDCLVPNLIAEALVAHTTDLVDYVDTSVNAMSATLSMQMEEIAKNVAATSGAPRTIYIQTGYSISMPSTGIFHKSFDDLVRIVSTGQHIYLPGVPGGGKSHSGEQAADVLNWRFGSLSLSPMTPDSRLWGGKDANGHFHEPTFVELARYAANNPDSGALFVLDEMDNGNGGIIASMNSAMANGWFTAPNGDVINFSKNRNFVVMGCANTFGTGPTAEFAGRNRLDPATLDRFVYLPWETDLAMESALVHGVLDGLPNGAGIARDWLNLWNAVRENVEKAGLKVFVTMRGALTGARLIAAGYSGEKAFMFVLGNKMPGDQLAKVNPF